MMAALKANLPIAGDSFIPQVTYRLSEQHILFVFLVAAVVNRRVSPHQVKRPVDLSTRLFMEKEDDRLILFRMHKLFMMLC